MDLCSLIQLPQLPTSKGHTKKELRSWEEIENRKKKSLPHLIEEAGILQKKHIMYLYALKKNGITKKYERWVIWEKPILNSWFLIVFVKEMEAPEYGQVSLYWEVPSSACPAFQDRSVQEYQSFTTGYFKTQLASCFIWGCARELLVRVGKIKYIYSLPYANILYGLHGLYIVLFCTITIHPC